MGEWLVARIAAHRHEYAAEHIRRVGFESFYPQWFRAWGRPVKTEVVDLYPGYMFVRSPVLWYPIVQSSPAVYGIVGGDDLSPFRSSALDAHVEALLSSRRKDGFVPMPKWLSRSRFRRSAGDVVRSFEELVELINLPVARSS